MRFTFCRSMALYRLVPGDPMDLERGSASELLETTNAASSSSVRKEASNRSGISRTENGIRFPFRYFFVTSLLPLTALFTCVFISAVFHRANTVNTTCGVSVSNSVLLLV